MTVAVRFSTRQYEFSHMKAPRGYGYWIFADDDGTEYDAVGTYSDAKRIVIAKVRYATQTDGYTVVVLNVMP